MMDILCRRLFLKRFVQQVGICSVLTCSAACNTQRRPVARKLSLGPLTAFPEGETEVSALRLLLRRTGNRMQAISLTCTHQPCAVRRSAAGFLCPCHGSKFAADGQVEMGPAKSPLPFFQLSVETGELFVDLSKQVPAAVWLEI